MLDLINSSAIARAFILGLLFVLVVAATLGMLVLVTRWLGLRSELREIHRGQSLVDTKMYATLHARKDDAWSKLVDRIESAGLNLADTRSDALRERMIAAGFESAAAPRIYTLLRLVLIILLPLGVVGLLLLNGTELTVFKLYLLGSICALAGMYVPSLVVQARIDRRREAIVNGFPDSLDLMLVCVEAGLGLEAALDRVGREMALSAPLVADILTTATLQLRAGATREVALRRMGEAAKVDEIRSFATLLIQSDKLGTSIAQTLRIYASEMRERRRMRAEEKAHRIPVLISIPLVVCMLPTMIGVLILPAAVRVVRELLPALTGG
jgi:tight adherence protein C